MSRSLSALFVLPALLLPALAEAKAYKIDATHSSVGFAVKHLMVSTVRGSFTKFQGTVNYDPADFTTSSVDVTIDAASINTGNAKRDEHLRAPDFFEVETHPTITFKSKKVEGAPGALKVTGDLTMRGVTKEVVLDIEGPTDAILMGPGLEVRGASASTTINRKDFGLTYNTVLEAGGVAVSEEVKIQLDLELKEIPPAPPATAAAEPAK